MKINEFLWSINPVFPLFKRASSILSKGGFSALFTIFSGCLEKRIVHLAMLAAVIGSGLSFVVSLLAFPVPLMSAFTHHQGEVTC